MLAGPTSEIALCESSQIDTTKRIAQTLDLNSTILSDLGKFVIENSKAPAAKQPRAILVEGLRRAVYGIQPLALISSLALRAKLKSKTSLVFISRWVLVARFMSSIRYSMSFSSLVPSCTTSLDSSS